MSFSRFAAALSTAADLDAALAEVCQSALGRLGETPDLAFLFVSADRAAECDRIAEEVCQRLGTERLLGCTAESLVGVGREVEMEPALSLWLAKLPGSEILPMHLAFEPTPDGGAILGWPDRLIESWPADATILLLGEPYSFPADLLLEQVNDEHAGTQVLGGMASGAAAPGEHRLLLGRQAIDHGAVAVMLSGGVRVRTVVSQGCRPIGQPLVITKAERNVVFELGGKPAVEQANEIFRGLPARDRELVRRGLHLGRVVSEYKDHFEQGDFLIRNVVGADSSNGAVMITDYVRAGQTVQFHVRDAETADGEMRQLLARVKHADGAAPRGALLFTCNGRGTRLFPAPHHDAAVVGGTLGEIPLAGFFAQGEIGPVGNQNFMHGFTASIALFD